MCSPTGIAEKHARRVLSLVLLSASGIMLPLACSSEPPPPASSSSSTGTAAGTGGTGPDAGPSSSATFAVTTTSSGAGGSLPDVFTVSGIVTDGTSPLEGAIVMQGGGQPALTTGPDGAYTIELTQAIAGTPVVVASKIGYRTRGVEFTSLPQGPVDLVLRIVAPPDNALGYTYGEPGVGELGMDISTAYCGHCHTTIVKLFQSSAHARATKDPLVQDLYAGVSQAYADQTTCQAAGGMFLPGLIPGTAGMTMSKCYLGGGVLPDLNATCGSAGQLACDDPLLPLGSRPTAFGRCADCHAAAMDGPAGGRNLLDATGIAFEHGNHCDACHKARDVDLTKPPGTAGALVIQRPHETISPDPGAELLQVMFGPLPDVPNAFMGGSYQPKFATAEFCGACHEQKQEALLPGAALDPLRWPDGLPVHSTYSEWLDGPFNTPATPCQLCHMPPIQTLASTVDVTDASNAGITFGFVRPPEQIRSHIFRGPLEGTPRLIDSAATVSVLPTAGPTGLSAKVTIKNNGAGHAIPTGEPMRSLILLVGAEACGAPMTPSAGMTLDDTAGALAEQVLMQDLSNATAIDWPAGAAVAKAGDVLRAVRWTGNYLDYPGIGFFANPALSAAEKGIPLREPAGQASIAAVAGNTLTLAAPLNANAGDILLLGEAMVWPPADGAPSRALSGSAGQVFARTLVDPLGARNVPHYRAIDIASDNRIAPQAAVVSQHLFAIPPGCNSAQVTASLLYRPVPVDLARRRGWDARDYVIASASQVVMLP